MNLKARVLKIEPGLFLVQPGGFWLAPTQIMGGIVYPVWNRILLGMRKKRLGGSYRRR